MNCLPLLQQQENQGMDAKTYHRNNFHKYTFCVFNEADLSEVSHLKPDYKSKSGSVYYFSETGVFRLSNHWGRAANCKWRLQTDSKSESRTKLGFALWTSFHRDNDAEKLYFIEADIYNNSVNFQHKDNGGFRPEFVLRTASETTKRLKQIRSLQTNDRWTKHFSEDSEMVKKKAITQLIQTDKPLSQIKSELL